MLVEALIRAFRDEILDHPEKFEHCFACPEALAEFLAFGEAERKAERARLQ